MKCEILVSLVLGLCLGLVEGNGYVGYQEWEIHVTNKVQAAKLQHLENAGQVDILKEPRLGEPGVILVSPSQRNRAQMYMLTSGITTKVITADFDKKVAKQYEAIRQREETEPYFNVNKYNNFTQLMSQLDVWVSSCPTGLDCSLKSIGKSYEGRDMKLITIKKKDTTNKILYFEFTIHCREWLSTTSGQKMINKIINDYTTDSDTKNLLENYEIHVLLVANPDGYVYTMVKQGGTFPYRMWRKSRSPNTGSSCKGADLNRNFNDQWGKQGTSSSPCSNTFAGSSPASEVEVQNMQKHMDSIKGRALATYAVHCCAKMWMFPYGYTQDFDYYKPCVKTTDHDDLTQAAKAGVDAVEAESGVRWASGTICSTIYPVTGSTGGYSYTDADIKYSWSIEVDGWFDSGEDEIEPVFTQFWRALIASTNEIEKIEA